MAWKEGKGSVKGLVRLLHYQAGKGTGLISNGESGEAGPYSKQEFRQNDSRKQERGSVRESGNLGGMI
jgi:hypothetical protein